MANIVLGRYVPYNSFIHKMDARNKIICLILLMVAVFLSYPTYEITFIVGGFLAVFIFALLMIARVSLRSIFKSLKVLWIFILILVLINTFLPPTGAQNIAFTIGKVKVYWEAIFQTLKIIIRLVLMIELTMILTATTKPLDLTYGLEWYLTPLKVIKFPAHEVAMTISIALRFIPTILDETERIMKAQSSRGVDFKHGKVSARLKAIVSLIIPLFISSFQRSEELADSMEARGYDPRAKRTRYHVLRFGLIDALTFVLVVLVMAGTIVLSSTGWGLAHAHFVPIFVLVIIGLFIYTILIGIIIANRKKQ